MDGGGEWDGGKVNTQEVEGFFDYLSQSGTLSNPRANLFIWFVGSLLQFYVLATSKGPVTL